MTITLRQAPKVSEIGLSDTHNVPNFRRVLLIIGDFGEPPPLGLGHQQAKMEISLLQSLDRDRASARGGAPTDLSYRATTS